MLTERRFDTGLVEINYAEGPAAGPPLLFLHGITNCWQRWLTALPVFTLRWRVVAADLRGHGSSGRVANVYGLMDYVPDIIALLRHLGGEPSVVVGHSLGAMIAIGLAAEAPGSVRAVVLEDPPLGAFTGAPFETRPEHDRFVAQRDMLRAGLAPAELARRVAALQPTLDALAVRVRSSRLSRIDPEVLTPVIDGCAIDNYDLGDRLRRMACPTLLLQGNPALGGALSDEEAAWAASLVPDVTHVAYPDLGHNIHVASGPKAGRFVDLVSGFLETVQADAE